MALCQIQGMEKIHVSDLLYSPFYATILNLCLILFFIRFVCSIIKCN